MFKCFIVVNILKDRADQNIYRTVNIVYSEDETIGCINFDDIDFATFKV